MANKDSENDPKSSTTPAYLFGLFMILLAGIAVAILIAILVINKEKLSIDKAGEYERDDTLEIEYKGND